MKQRKGIALVVSLMILLILTLLGVAIMMFAVNEEQIVGNQMRHIRSLAYAEAGVSEVVRRLNLEEIGDPMVGGIYNKDWATYILLYQNPGNVSQDTFCVASVQMGLPAGSQILTYSTEEPNPDRDNSLIVHHWVNSDNPDEIFYYNWNTRTREPHNPANFDGAFFPIEVVEATGMLGSARRKIRVEVVRRSGPCNVASAMSCNFDVKITGTFICCGHNHLFSTPWGTSKPPEKAECFDDPDDPLDPICHEHRSDGQPHAIRNFNGTNDPDSFYMKVIADPICTQAGCLPGVSAPGDSIELLGAQHIRGNPDITNDPTIVTFYPLWQMLGASSWEDLETKYPWQPIPAHISGGSYIGFYKCDGDMGIAGQVDFTGVLWVTGSLKVAGALEAKGLIYSHNDMELGGGTWILGAVAIEDTGQTLISPINATVVILYSSEAIQRAIAAGGGYTTISWSEE